MTYKDDMLDVLPHYYKDSPQFNDLLSAYEAKLQELGQQVDKINDNVIIATAVEMLPVHERDLGMVVPSTLDPVLRREQIISKYRSVFAQTTEATIVEVAESFAKGAIAIAETLTPGLYTITFTDQLGVPYNMEGLQKAVRDVLPAHLDVEYIIMYNTWNWALDFTWNGLALDTWDGIKEKEV